MSRLVGIGLLLAGVLYPFAVHYGLGHFAPWQFAVLLGALWLARALSAPRRPGGLWLALAVLAFCGVLALADSAQLLRWYPVLISLGMLGLFGTSLLHGMPLAERLARLREPELPPRAVRYTRRVTQAWCVFFLANGLIAAALALWGSQAWWTLYNGLIAYLAMGLLFAIEWLIRQRVRGRP